MYHVSRSTALFSQIVYRSVFYLLYPPFLSSKPQKGSVIIMFCVGGWASIVLEERQKPHICTRFIWKVHCCNLGYQNRSTTFSQLFTRFTLNESYCVLFLFCFVLSHWIFLILLSGGIVLAFVSLAVCTPGWLQGFWIPFSLPVRQTTDRIENAFCFFLFSRWIIVRLELE